MSFAKKNSKYDPLLADQGIPYVAGAGKPGVSVVPLLITQVGAAPYHVVFASLGLPDMANAGYVVLVHSESSSGKVDESTKATTGFDLISGSDGDVINVVVVGQIKGQVV